VDAFFTNAQAKGIAKPIVEAPPILPEVKRVPVFPTGDLTVSLAIMAHRSREARVKATKKRLDRPARTAWDHRGDRWDTGRRAMLAADMSCSHHAVIQDDILIPFDLAAGLEEALRHIPVGSPLCGYIGRVRPSNQKVRDVVAVAERDHASWITMRQLHWGPLICVPTDCIREMVAYCDKLTGISNYDLRISRYFEDKGILVWYTWPSLVDHADGPSLVEGRMGVNRAHAQNSRIAHKFCGENCSALSLSWSGPVVKAR